LKTSLKKLRSGRFFDVQESRNEMESPFEIMKHRFIEITTVVFQNVQKAYYVFSVPFEYLKQLLKLQTSLFFDALIAENEFE
jgi:hypothetical protein